MAYKVAKPQLQSMVNTTKNLPDQACGIVCHQSLFMCDVEHEAVVERRACTAAVQRHYTGRADMPEVCHLSVFDKQPLRNSKPVHCLLARSFFPGKFRMMLQQLWRRQQLLLCLYANIYVCSGNLQLSNPVGNSFSFSLQPHKLQQACWN